MLTVDFWYAFFKVLSFIATGAFGALGLLTKYKNDDNTITKPGKIALGGLVLSSLLSLGIFVLETTRASAASRKAKVEAEATVLLLQSVLRNAKRTVEQQKASLAQIDTLKSELKTTADAQLQNLQKSDSISEGMEKSLTAQRDLQVGNEEIMDRIGRSMDEQAKLRALASRNLSDTQRLLRPINSIQMRLGLTISKETQGVKSYLSSLEPLEALFNHVDMLGNWDVAGKEEIARRGLYEPWFRAVGIPEASHYYPSAETSLRDVVSIKWVDLLFYRRPIDPATFDPFVQHINQFFPVPDFKARMRSDQSNPLRLYYFGPDKDLRIMGELISDPDEWEMSGNLVSVNDLDHGQVFIAMGPAGKLTAGKKMNWLEDRRHFQLSGITLRIAKQAFLINGHSLEQFTTQEGIPYWLYSFEPLNR